MIEHILAMVPRAAPKTEFETFQEVARASLTSTHPELTQNDRDSMLATSIISTWRQRSAKDRASCIRAVEKAIEAAKDTECRRSYLDTASWISSELDGEVAGGPSTLLHDRKHDQPDGDFASDKLHTNDTISPKGFYNNTRPGCTGLVELIRLRATCKTLRDTLDHPRIYTKYVDQFDVRFASRGSREESKEYVEGETGCWLCRLCDETPSTPCERFVGAEFRDPRLSSDWPSKNAKDQVTEICCYLANVDCVLRAPLLCFLPNRDTECAPPSWYPASYRTLTEGWKQTVTRLADKMREGFQGHLDHIEQSDSESDAGYTYTHWDIDSNDLDATTMERNIAKSTVEGLAFVIVHHFGGLDTFRNFGTLHEHHEAVDNCTILTTGWGTVDLISYYRITDNLAYAVDDLGLDPVDGGDTIFNPEDYYGKF